MSHTRDSGQIDVVDTRIAELIAKYSSPESSTANLLCDRYDPARVAYRIVAPPAPSREITFGELRRESEQVAGALHARGIRAGDRVATLMGKSAEYLFVLVGIWRLGAVHVPLFTAFAPPAIALRLSGSGAKLVFCDESQRPKLDPAEAMPANSDWDVVVVGDAGPNDLSYADFVEDAEPYTTPPSLDGKAPLIHIYTSGTTGNPKGVVMPVRALASCEAYAEFGQGIVADDVFWCAADPGWAYGLYFGILSSLTTGVCSILLSGGFSAENTLAVLEQERVTNFAAAPTVYRALRAADLPVPNSLALNKASSAGEPLTPEVNDWAEQFLGVSVHDHYGQTEAGMLINNHHHRALSRPIKPGSMGQAMPGWRAAVLAETSTTELGPDEPGRVAMDLSASPLAWFDGYVGDPAKTSEKFSPDGRWYFTGDTGKVDADGYFYFSARDDDVIIMAGYRIGPFEVESTLATHPAVAESAVIAIPDPVRGEVLEACVVLRGGFERSDALEAELQQWVKRNFAAHAYPRRVHFIAEMPKTPSGKIQRFVLKSRRLAEVEAAAGA